MDINIGIPRRLSYLPVVMDILRKSGLFSIIDKAVYHDPRSKVSTSECVAVILCGVFVGHHDLWRMADRLTPFDMLTVMRNPKFDLALFTEERLAKALDDLYAANLDNLMTTIAIRTIEAFRLAVDYLGFDTTSLVLFGAHENEDFGSMGDDSAPSPPVITYGYSKDHRSDLKQILFGSLVTHDGGVPLYGKAIDGNRSDNESAARFLHACSQYSLKPQRGPCCVADSQGVVCSSSLSHSEGKDEDALATSTQPCSP